MWTAIAIAVMLLIAASCAIAMRREQRREEQLLSELSQYCFLKYNSFGLIQTIGVYGVCFDDRQVPALLGLRHLRELFIDHTGLSMNGAIAAASHPGIRTLVVFEPKFGDQDLAKIVESSTASRLQLDGRGLTNRSHEWLVGLRRLEYLLLPAEAKGWSNLNAILKSLPQCTMEFAP